MFDREIWERGHHLDWMRECSLELRPKDERSSSDSRKKNAKVVTQGRICYFPGTEKG